MAVCSSYFITIYIEINYIEKKMRRKSTQVEL